VDVVFLIGRILFVVLFVWSGVFNHFSRGGIEYARMYGAPAPDLLVPLSGAAAILGSAMIVLGVFADVGALILIAFLVPISYFMHAYWKETDPQTKQGQQVNFLKNVGLIGGALVIFYAYNQLQGEAGLSITDPLFGRAD
jgi:putative oxidoreductase